MRRVILAVVVLMAGCSGPEAGAQQKTGDPKQDAKNAVIQAAGVVYASQDEVVADESVLKRLADKDETLKPADLDKLYSAGRGTDYVTAFETASKAVPIVLRFRSKDNARFGFLEKVGDHYTVIVYGNPTEGMCYSHVAAFRYPVPKPEPPNADGSDSDPPELLIRDQMMRKATQWSLRKQYCFST